MAIDPGAFVVCRKQLDGTNVAIFEPDLTETTTIARATQFVEGNLSPTVFGFRRARYNRLHVPAWSEVELGRTEDGRYWKRLKALVRALPVIAKNRECLRSSFAFLARNLDQLLLALLAQIFFNRRALLAYEVVDIQPAFTRAGFRGAMIRLIERLCLGKIDLLVVSSPAFHRDYFSTTQRYRGDWLLVENKLRLPMTDPGCARGTIPAVKSLHTGPRWVIGYFGLIRGQATIELMVRLAKLLPDKIELRFRGVITTVDEAWFRSVVEESENISYDGEYSNPRDLPALYGSVDLAWAIDLEDIACNSRWLLPCRFYEAGFFGVPCLAVRGFEFGELLDRLDVGWTFDHPLEESLVRFFATLTSTSYQQKRRNLMACPANAFAAGNDGGGLCGKLEELARGKSGDQVPKTSSAVPAAASDKVPMESLEAE
jgi:succinoglycan biosynthesis protein ExoL